MFSYAAVRSPIADSLAPELGASLSEWLLIDAVSASPVVPSSATRSESALGQHLRHTACLTGVRARCLTSLALVPNLMFGLIPPASSSAGVKRPKFHRHRNDAGLTLSAANLALVTLGAQFADACDMAPLVVQILETSDDA